MVTGIKCQHIYCHKCELFLGAARASVARYCFRSTQIQMDTNSFCLPLSPSLSSPLPPSVPLPLSLSVSLSLPLSLSFTLCLFISFSVSPSLPRSRSSFPHKVPLSPPPLPTPRTRGWQGGREAASPRPRKGKGRKPSSRGGDRGTEGQRQRGTEGQRDRGRGRERERGRGRG